MISSRESSSTNGSTTAGLLENSIILCDKLHSVFSAMHTQNITIASRRTPVKVGQSLAKCPTLEIKFSFRELSKGNFSPAAAVAVTGGVALLSHPCHNTIMLEPGSPELGSVALDKVPPAATRHVDKLALLAIPTGNCGHRSLHYRTSGWSAIVQVSEAGFSVHCYLQGF